MARAKRTDRTEARRRYRAQQTAELAGPADEGEDDLVHPAAAATTAERKKGTSPSGAVAPAGGSKGSGAASGARPARPSIGASARAAYRPPNVREDLQALPRLLLHWSVLVSAGIAVVSTVGIIALGAATSTSGSSAGGSIVAMVFSLFVGAPSPPPFGAVLLMGFMLPRASWLVGLVYGVLASVCFTVALLAQPASTLTGQSILPVLVQVWLVGILGTMLFTAGIAWYRRFLDQLNPNRGQRRQQPQKAGQGRGNAPRNRLSGSSR